MPVLGFHHGRMHGSFDSSDSKLSDFQWNIYTFFYIHALNDKFDEGGLFYYIKVPLPPEGIFFFIIFILTSQIWMIDLLLFSLY